MIILYSANKLDSDIHVLVTSTGGYEINEGLEPKDTLIVGVETSSFLSPPMLIGITTVLQVKFNDYFTKAKNNILNVLDGDSYTLYRQSKDESYPLKPGGISNINELRNSILNARPLRTDKPKVPSERSSKS